MAIGNFLTTLEAAQVIGVCDSRVRQFYRDGNLPALKIGTNLLFDRRTVERFAKKPRPMGRPPKKKSS